MCVCMKSKPQSDGKKHQVKNKNKNKRIEKVSHRMKSQTVMTSITYIVNYCANKQTKNKSCCLLLLLLSRESQNQSQYESGYAPCARTEWDSKLFMLLYLSSVESTYPSEQRATTETCIVGNIQYKFVHIISCVAFRFWSHPFAGTNSFLVYWVSERAFFLHFGFHCRNGLFSFRQL